MSVRMKKHHIKDRSSTRASTSTKKRASYHSKRAAQRAFSEVQITHSNGKVEFFDLPRESMPDIVALINGRTEGNNVDWRQSFRKEIKEVGEPALALKGARAKEGITQKELADRLGASQAYVSQLESGRKEINKSTAQIFGKIFNVNYKIFL